MHILIKTEIILLLNTVLIRKKQPNFNLIQKKLDNAPETEYVTIAEMSIQLQKIRLISAITVDLHLVRDNSNRMFGIEYSFLL